MLNTQCGVAPRYTPLLGRDYGTRLEVIIGSFFGVPKKR